MVPAGKVNLVLSALGAAVFASLFLYNTLAPREFDRHARDFAVARVQERVDGELQRLGQSEALARASTLAGRLSERLQGQIDSLRAGLNVGTDRLIADVLAANCRIDCERQEQARAAVRAIFEGEIARHGIALSRLQDMILGHYQAVMERMRGDVKVFAGCNLLAFSLAFALTLFSRDNARYLLPVSLILTGATLLAIAWYVFGQDWVLTVIYSDYWGWAYATVLSLLFLLMLDIALNGARIVRALVGGIFGVVPTPC